MNNEGQRGIYFKSKQAVLCLLAASENKKYKTSQLNGTYYRNSNLTHLKYYSIFLAEINFI